MSDVQPIPMLLWCPAHGCGARHIDEGDFATKPHHTHACQSCGMVWRPAIVPTVGVAFLPGFKNGAIEYRPPSRPAPTGWTDIHTGEYHAPPDDKGTES